MGEYEPNDSRKITLSNDTAPGEPPRTGPREGETRAEGEKGVRAAPRLNLNGEPVDENGRVQPARDPQASQSQWQGGQTQSLGGLSQSQGSFGGPLEQPAASHGANTRPEQPGNADSGTSAGWAADFAPEQSEAASGHSAQQPQNMQQADAADERTRRQQAAGQGSPDAQQGLGYGAQDGKEMGDAPDVSDPSQRGYGGGGEERLRKLEEGS